MRGVDRIIGNNAAVVDLEIAMHRDHALAQNDAVSGKIDGAPRMDIVSLESARDDAKIVLWEVKTLDDPRLRAESECNSEVTKQLKSYHKYLANPERCDAIKRAYETTCSRLVELKDMRSNPVNLDRLIVEAARGKIRLGVDLQPRLIIFGLKNGKSSYEDKYSTRNAERMINAEIWATYAIKPGDIDLTADAKPIALGVRVMPSRAEA